MDESQSHLEPLNPASATNSDATAKPDAASQTPVPAVAAPLRRASVARSAGIVSLAVMSSRVLGLARESVFTYFFGASKSYANDAFLMAFRIPNLLRDLFAEGALSSAFVPVFSDTLLNKGEKEAYRLSNFVATALTLVLGVLVILGIIFAPQIVAAIAHGFQDNPEKFALTVRLTRIMMPFILLLALAAQVMGILNSRGKFAVPAFASTFFNLGSIIAGILCAAFLVDPTFAHPIRAIVEHPIEGIVGMAYGVLIGGFLQLAVQWPTLYREGFRYRPMLSFRDPGMRRILLLMGPAVIGASAVQVNVLINSNFASSVVNPLTGTIDNGPVTWLNCAFRLVQFPIGVFGVAISTATLPAISQSAALAELGEFKRTLAASLRLALLMTIPSAVGLAVLSRPIIALIYEHGNFTATDTIHAADALAFYAIGLAGYSAIKILAPAFYALGDARKPMIFSLVSILVNFTMSWILVGVWQERGLALSTSISALLNSALLYLALRSRIRGLEGRQTTVTVMKIGMSSAVMWVSCRLALHWLAKGFGTHFAAQVLTVLMAVAVGAAVFYGCAYLLGIGELQTAVEAMTRRFRRRPKQVQR